MEISQKLTPYWFTPEGQTGDKPVKFRIAPLTQPQIVELFDTYDKSGKPTNRTWYVAGEMGLNGGRGIENLTIEGRTAAWPRDKDRIPYDLVIACGVELCLQAWKVDSEEAEKN